MRPRSRSAVPTEHSPHTVWNDAPAIFDILQDLCEDSLLRQERSLDGSIRYMQLESIRAYAHQKLAQDGAVEQGLSGEKALKETVMRHARHYASFGQEVFITRAIIQF